MHKEYRWQRPYHPGDGLVLDRSLCLDRERSQQSLPNRRAASTFRRAEWTRRQQFALSDALTSLGNEITQQLEAKLDRLLIVMGVGFAALAVIIAVMAVIIMVVAGDSGQDIHYYGAPTPTVAVPVGFTPAS